MKLHRNQAQQLALVRGAEKVNYFNYTSVIKAQGGVRKLKISAVPRRK